MLNKSLDAAQRVCHVHMRIVCVNKILKEEWVVEIGTSAFSSFLKKMIARRIIYTYLVQFFLEKFIVIEKYSHNIVKIGADLVDFFRIFCIF